MPNPMDWQINWTKGRKRVKKTARRLAARCKDLASKWRRKWTKSQRLDIGYEIVVAVSSRLLERVRIKLYVSGGGGQG